MAVLFGIKSCKLLLLGALVAFGFGCHSQAAKAEQGAKQKLKPYLVRDAKQGNLPVCSLGVPVDWQTSSQVQWNYADLYRPASMRARVQAPDGQAWVELYPAQFFWWLTPPARNIGSSVGGIHHPNITLPEAMVRYVIVPNRRSAKNLKILGYRPVNLSKAFPEGVFGACGHRIQARPGDLHAGGIRSCGGACGRGVLRLHASAR